MFGRKRQPGGANSGIQNSGNMQYVQNQPDAYQSTQSQDNSGIGREELQGIADLLGQIRQGMERERDRVNDYALCVGFLDTVTEQPLDNAEGRAVAKGLLEKIQQKCGGVPGLVSLIASTLSAVSALA
ncbi:hypothetical protein H9Y04_43555 [Streptomyces sp. TRM66268-LWL]|uniref:Uncharacterized protein n=1 Tax=Streptomyces polyasparticus TaxID=2767826 RepID=A0ABR7SX88_9ACTN|nr:hypothetical protein [Streptomyces polyasparticus]MBC9719409.1 hypothetical protein [Streptomyces polyasparticus]